MKELTSRLTKELQQDGQTKVMEVFTWNLPVYEIEVEYETVTRTTMDILMKMMLIAVQKAELEDVETVSRILLVEPIFVEDLMRKMMNARLIKKQEGVFTLTDAGRHQLARGILEQDAEGGTQKMVYSPCHGNILHGEVHDEFEEQSEDYRYLEYFHDWEVTSLKEAELIEALQHNGVESKEGHVQTVVSKIASTKATQVESIPCVELRLYHEEQDVMYCRVWNTFLAQWDETLESELHKKERQRWRAHYLSDETTAE